MNNEELASPGGTPSPSSARPSTGQIPRQAAHPSDPARVRDRSLRDARRIEQADRASPWHQQLHGARPCIEPVEEVRRDVAVSARLGAAGAGDSRPRRPRSRANRSDLDRCQAGVGQPRASRCRPRRTTRQACNGESEAAPSSRSRIGTDVQVRARTWNRSPSRRARGERTAAAEVRATRACSISDTGTSVHRRAPTTPSQRQARMEIDQRGTAFCALTQAPRPGRPPVGGGGVRPRLPRNGCRLARHQIDVAGLQAPLQCFAEGNHAHAARRYRCAVEPCRSTGPPRTRRNRRSARSLHPSLGHEPLRGSREGRREGEVHIIDPATGERRMPLSAVSTHFTGVALELEPSPTFRAVRQQDSKLPLSAVWGRIRGLRTSALQILVLALRARDRRSRLAVLHAVGR